MGALDWTVFLLFLVYVVVDGIRRGRKSKDLEGYFAGGRKIPWWAAGLSIMATQASAITVIGTTGQGHDHGMEFVQTYFGLAFAMVILCIFFIPLYRQSPILTAYQYLEGRFGPATRTLASLIFLVSRCLALSVVLYAPAVVLSVLLGLGELTTILIVGVITTIYTMIGGVHAVIWTDVKQMAVIIFGLVVCLVILLMEVVPEVGGLHEAFLILGHSDKLNPVEMVPGSVDFVPRLKGGDGATSFWEEKYNFWSGTIGGLFLMLAYFGCDQSQVQRILTNPSVRQSRMALLVSAFAKVPMQVVVLLIGVLVYLFFVLNPGPLLFSSVDREIASQGNAAVRLHVLQEDHAEATERRKELAKQIAGTGVVSKEYGKLVRDIQQMRKEALRIVAEEEAATAKGAPLTDAESKGLKRKDTNFVFPHFIMNNLPPILLGLLIAAIFAAAMSSVDSVLNSLTAASVVDFYKRWIRPEVSESQALRVSKGLTVFWGMMATIGAIALFRGAGSVIEVVNRVGSYFYGSLLGVFVLALCCRRAGARAGFLGLCGGLCAVLVTYFTVHVAFLWYNVIGCAGVLVVGGIASLTERRG